MRRRLSLPFLAAFTLAIAPVAFLNCSGNDEETCDASNCDGCCDSQGQCVTGNQSNACGINGAACTNCLASGLACLSGLQTCGTGSTGGNDAGTGGTDAGTDAGMDMDAGTDGGMDMDAGTDGGTTPACRELTMFVRDEGFAGFEAATSPFPYDLVAWAEVYGPIQNDAFDVVSLEVWRTPAGEFAPTPVVRTFTPSVKLADCDVCLYYYEGCDDEGCAGEYVATGGTFTVSEYTQDTNAGRVQAAGSTLQFSEWDYDADAPLAGGRCINLTALAIDESW